MDIQPTRDLVLVKADKADEQTKSGFFLAENWKTLPLTGEVLAVGPLVTQLKAGDKIGFARYGTIQLSEDERLCKESHILWLF